MLGLAAIAGALFYFLRRRDQRRANALYDARPTPAMPEPQTAQVGGGPGGMGGLGAVGAGAGAAGAGAYSPYARPMSEGGVSVGGVSAATGTAGVAGMGAYAPTQYSSGTEARLYVRVILSLLLPSLPPSLRADTHPSQDPNDPRTFPTAPHSPGSPSYAGTHTSYAGAPGDAANPFQTPVHTPAATFHRPAGPGQYTGAPEL